MTRRDTKNRSFRAISCGFVDRVYSSSRIKEIVAQIDSVGWAIGKVYTLIKNRSFTDEIRRAVAQSFARTFEIK